MKFCISDKILKRDDKFYAKTCRIMPILRGFEFIASFILIAQRQIKGDYRARELKKLVACA